MRPCRSSWTRASGCPIGASSTRCWSWAVRWGRTRRSTTPGSWPRRRWSGRPPKTAARSLESASGCRCWRRRSAPRCRPMRDGPRSGLLPVELTAEGREHPLFAGMPEPLVSLQWHGDTFELPEGATLLASSPAAPQPGLPGRRGRLRRPVPPRGDRRDGARVGRGAGLPRVARRDAGRGAREPSSWPRSSGAPPSSTLRRSGCSGTGWTWPQPSPAPGSSVCTKLFSHI